MITNYLKIALRTLRRQKLYAAINVFSLAVGLAFCILVLLFVHDELSHDRFHERADRLYRLYRDSVRPDSPVNRELSMPVPAGPAMQTTFPEVESYVRIDFPGGMTTVRHDGALIEQEDLLAADSSFFDVFSFPLVQGDPETALSDPYSIVLTRAAARRYFGKEDPMGRTLSLRLSGEYVDLTVTGVAEEPPSHSTIRFAALIPYPLFVQRFDYMERAADRWDATRSITYVLLREGADVETVRARMPAFMETYLGSLFDELRAEGYVKDDELPSIYRLQPLREVHLNPAVPSGITPPSDPRYSYILAAIALAVLLIACINFMLLALGRSFRRAREVGVRKALGAQRSQLMGQFWGEALLLSALALGLGLLLTRAALPIFNGLAGKTLALDAVDGILAAAVLFGLLVLTGLVAGSYPAFLLARQQPVDTLRDRSRLGGANTLTRGLVVAQFTLSVFLIASTVVMMQQLRHLRTTHLGFSGEQVVVIPTRGLDGEEVLQRYDALGRQQPGVVHVAGANIEIGRGLMRRGFRYEGALKQVVVFRVTPDYLKTMQIDLRQGRSFDDRRDGAAGTVLVNEALVRDFGWDDAVGRPFPVEWDTLQSPTVIGVVKDFHFESLHHAVQPTLLTTAPISPIRSVYVRLRPDDVPATLERLRETWGSLTADVPFAYRFVDDSMDQLYRAEERWSRIVGYGSLFAVLVACLGLFGIATLTTARRTKEIGIRKVLGASAGQIVALLSKDFARLILLAIVLAVPAAYLAMHRWLQEFASRIELGAGVFVLAGALGLLLALATVGSQALRAARVDPARSLRYE